MLTSQQDAGSIIAQQRRCGTNTIQIVDQLPIDDYKIILDALPGISLVQVIHVTDEESVEEAISMIPFVNGILLDSGNQSLVIKELGGTGRVHDWTMSKKIIEAVNIPIFLAGGLNADNVAEAITQDRLFGVDLCSGVRTNGKLDEEKPARFFKQVDSVSQKLTLIPCIIIAIVSQHLLIIVLS